MLGRAGALSGAWGQQERKRQRADRPLAVPCDRPQAAAAGDSDCCDAAKAPSWHGWRTAAARRANSIAACRGVRHPFCPAFRSALQALPARGGPPAKGWGQGGAHRAPAYRRNGTRSGQRRGRIHHGRRLRPCGRRIDARPFTRLGGRVHHRRFGHPGGLRRSADRRNRGRRWRKRLGGRQRHGQVLPHKTAVQDRRGMRGASPLQAQKRALARGKAQRAAGCYRAGATALRHTPCCSRQRAPPP